MASELPSAWTGHSISQGRQYQQVLLNFRRPAAVETALRLFPSRLLIQGFFHFRVEYPAKGQRQARQDRPGPEQRAGPIDGKSVMQAPSQ